MGGSFSRRRATRIERTGGRSGTIVPGRKTGGKFRVFGRQQFKFPQGPEVITRIALPGELFRPESRVYTTPYTTISLPTHPLRAYVHARPPATHPGIATLLQHVSRSRSRGACSARIVCVHDSNPLISPRSSLCCDCVPVFAHVNRAHRRHFFFFSRRENPPLPRSPPWFTVRSFHRSRRTVLFLGCRALSLAVYVFARRE